MYTVNINRVLVYEMWEGRPSSHDAERAVRGAVQPLQLIQCSLCGSAANGMDWHQFATRGVETPSLRNTCNSLKRAQSQCKGMKIHPVNIYCTIPEKWCRQLIHHPPIILLTARSIYLKASFTSRHGKSPKLEGAKNACEAQAIACIPVNIQFLA